MKKILLLLLLLLLFIIIFIGCGGNKRKTDNHDKQTTSEKSNKDKKQENQDKKQLYNYWAHRGIIEVIYAYMEDYEDTVGKEMQCKEIKGKILYEKKFIAKIDSLKTESLPELDDVATFLKENGWTNCNDKIFQALKDQYEKDLKKVDRENKAIKALETLFNDLKREHEGKNVPIYHIPRKKGEELNKSRIWGSKSKEIIEKYKTSLSELKVKESELESDCYEDKCGSFWKILFQIACIFIIGILIGSVLIVLITKSRIKSIINEEDGRKYDDYSLAAIIIPYIFFYLDDVINLLEQKNRNKKDSESVKQKNGELTTKIFQLEKKKKELFDENIDLNKKLERESIHKNEGKREEQNQKTKNIISQPPKSKTILYFSIPENNGSFQITHGHSMNDGKKHYRIEFEENTKQGELFYISGDRDARAINHKETYLNPVCDIENYSSASTATKIKLIHSGKVSRLNDSWIIDNKIKIKLY